MAQSPSDYAPDNSANICFSMDTSRDFRATENEVYPVTGEGDAVHVSKQGDTEGGAEKKQEAKGNEGKGEKKENKETKGEEHFPPWEKEGEVEYEEIPTIHCKG